MDDREEIPFGLSRDGAVMFLTLVSSDGHNRLTRSKVESLRAELENLCTPGLPTLPLVISGNKYFSVGADLNEIKQLRGPSAAAFAKAGQALMDTIDSYPVPVCAAVTGYCMGGGMDLALACDYRIASPHAVFGHRGAALGLITGWGGTQRLARLIGSARAIEMFISAEKVDAKRALRYGLVDQVCEDPLAEAMRWVERRSSGDPVSR
jgi:enoyl-CoA hydratase/carnithine racemase